MPCSWGMLVTLKATKTLQFRSKPIEIVYFLCCTSTLCVLTMLCPACWPHQGGPWIHYFVCLIIAVCPILFSSNVFDLSCNVLAIIHRITGDILLEGVLLPRAGSVGLSDYDIKMLGYWSSDCFFTIY